MCSDLFMVFLKFYTDVLFFYHQMETHCSKLSELCRLCASTIRREAHYKNIKSKGEFQSQILTLFKYDIDNDEITKHPTHLCAKCVKKLHKVVVKATVHQPQEIIEFEPHVQ